MELITFEPRNIIFSLLFFLSGCIAFQPPEPVTITTPSSVSSEKINTAGKNNVVLLFELNNAGTISYSVEAIEKKSILKEIPAKDQKQIEGVIEEAIQLAKGSEKKLNVLIKNDKASLTHFKTLINALKSKDIYTFQLVTDPEGQ